MNRNIILIPLLILFAAVLFSSCQQDQNQTDDKTKQSSENLYYDCMESKIVIDANTTVLDNKRGQWSLSFDGTLKCGETPIKGAEVNVKSEIRNTDLTIKTGDTGNFSVKVNRLEESPSGKDFVVTLMGTKEATITKSFKVK